MKQFNFESKHRVEIEKGAQFAKLSRAERTAVVVAMGFVPQDLLKAHDLTTDKGREAYTAAMAAHMARMSAAQEIDRIVNNAGALSDKQAAMTVGELGLTSAVTYECQYEKLPFKQRCELLTKWAQGINAEIAAAEKASK